MSMRVMLATIAILAFAPVLGTHKGFGPRVGVGSGYTSTWQIGAQGNASEESTHLGCIAAGADLLRRAAPAINGTAMSQWARRSGAFAPGTQLLCARRSTEAG
jgi:hypothetical protein